MIPLFSTAQIRDIDEYAVRCGFPGSVLMENASLEIYRHLEKRILIGNSTPKIGFVCGKGNNGGDGFAAARHCINNGYNVKILFLGSEDELSDDCRINFRIIESYGKKFKNISLKKFSDKKDIDWLKDCGVVVDALLGSGAKGELRQPYRDIVEKLNKLDSLKVAVDIPTGLDADTGSGSLIFKADLTITLGELKKGLFIGDGAFYSGEVLKGNIGISERFYDELDTKEYIIEPEDILTNIPKKRKDLHKYSAGKVLTIAGSGKMPGAAVLASKSVLRTGAGASVLLFPKSVRKLVHKNLTEVIVDAYDDNNSEHFSSGILPEIKGRLKWADVIAIGPGLGRDNAVLEGVRQLIKTAKSKFTVIDADALFALNRGYNEFNLSKAVLTPHLGEFSSLIGVEVNEIRKDPLKYGREFVAETGSFLVLKGAPTIIFSPSGEVFVNSAGNPGMAKFGTGDVLTGIIAGFLAQLKDMEKAVLTAVYLHSLSADLLIKEFTELSYAANDILENLPYTIKFLRRSLV